MSLSYDGSLLDHLAAHLPLHCIIIVAPHILSFCCIGLLLPVASLLSLASSLRVPLLADCCVHPPLLPPPAAITKKTFNTNVDIRVLQQLASGHQSNKSGDNAVMLMGGRRNESGRQKAQHELE